MNPFLLFRYTLYTAIYLIHLGVFEITPTPIKTTNVSTLYRMKCDQSPTWHEWTAMDANQAHECCIADLESTRIARGIESSAELNRSFSAACSAQWRAAKGEVSFSALKKVDGGGVEFGVVDNTMRKGMIKTIRLDEEEMIGLGSYNEQIELYVYKECVASLEAENGTVPRMGLE